MSFGDFRCSTCKHYVQGFSSNDQADKMRREWYGFCTAHAPVGTMVPFGQADQLPLQEYLFPIVAFNCRCAQYAKKEVDRQ